MRIAVLSLLLLAAGAANAQTPPTCTSAQFHQLDFWLGDWNAKWDASPGTPAGQGSNHITRGYEGCVIEEHFDGRPSQHLQGHSVSTYVAPTKNWRQTWVDNEDGYIDLAGGPNGKGEFVLTTLPRPNNARANRMIFTAITPRSFLWRWQQTLDGKTWTDSWVIHYTRKAA